MALVLNEEQRLLKDTAREFLDQRAPVAALRKLRDERSPLGYDASLWQEMCELGWASNVLPEAYGGLDFGFAGLGVVLEETGRSLSASPLLATSVCSQAILLGGSETQKDTLLPALASGDLTFALALEEHNHHRPHQIATQLERAADGFRLRGDKTFVIDGHSADYLLVVARGPNSDDTDLSLACVPRSSAGVDCQRTIMADSRNAANIRFDNVELSAEQIIGEPGTASALVDTVLDRARIALAAEMLGLAREAFERTVAYLKERKQFGALIGSFQALQHRAAIMQARIELAQSVVMQALSAIDDNPEQVPLLASLAKAQLNELVKLVSNEAVQMHGGIGVTDELEIGFFLKRARVTMQAFGDTGFHKDRYARLCGY